MKNHRFVFDKNKARNLTNLGSGECALTWTTLSHCHVQHYTHFWQQRTLAAK